MEAKNIRIGNWVNFDGEYVSVEAQDLNDWSYLERIKPILINDEWLNSLGFEFNGSTWQGDFDEGYSEWKLTSRGFIDYDEHLLWHNDRHYKYVHELQNLVFALTGCELDLKEEISACS